MPNFDFAPPKRSSIGLSASVAFNLLLLLIVAYLFLRPSAEPQPGPQPGPSVIAEDVVSIVAEAERARLMMDAEAAEEIAKKITAGEIRNSNQLYQWAKAYQDKIDETAYTEVNKLNNKYLAETEAGWNTDLIREYQSLKAQGKRKVAK